MFTERLVESFDGTRIYARCAGNGNPTVVLCDGLGCAGFLWRYLEPFLSARHRVIHWHYRGHGFSQHPPNGPRGLTVHAMLKDLDAVLKAYDVRDALLVGHSMGSQLILQAALDFAERVVGVVPICGSYGRPLETFHDHWAFEAAFPHLRDAVFKAPRLATWVWRGLLRSELAFRFAVQFEVNGSMLHREDFSPYFEHLARMDPEVFVGLVDDLRTHTTEDKLGEIRAPALIISGEKDTFTPVWLSRRMAHLVPDSELLVVRGATHVAPLEAPELIELRLERFFEERILHRANERKRSAGKHTQTGSPARKQSA